MIGSAQSSDKQSTVVADFLVNPGTSSYVDTPISVSLEGIALKKHTGQLQIYEIKGGVEDPVGSQIKPGMNDRLFWILNGETHLGEVRNFELRVKNDLTNGAEAMTSINTICPSLKTVH